MEIAALIAQKALQLNLDLGKFGTFAEIGAGQEIARWFFHVGKASGTIAKSISAYDMSVSDGLYGPTDRYVSRARLESMLDHEYTEVVQRLSAKRGGDTAFFVCADTVATQSHARRQGQGWMGVRFQAKPGDQPSEIIVHFLLWDPDVADAQAAAGILGVNLTYGAFYHHHDPELLMKSLIEGLNRRRIDLDMIKFSGPAFEGVDNRLMSLLLVENGLTDAAMFTADGEVVQPSEVLFGKPVLIERGSFRPLTVVTLDMLERAEEQLHSENPEKWEPPVVLLEMTLNNLASGPVIDRADFLARVDLLGAAGKTVLISNYTRFDRVTAYLRTSTQNRIGMVVGVPTLREIFDPKYYSELEGGLLEGLGRLFQGSVKLLVYPTRQSAGASVDTADAVDIQPEYRNLYSHLLQNGFIEPIHKFDADHLHITPAEVLQKIQAGDAAWESMVPPEVGARIKAGRLFRIARMSAVTQLN